MRIIFSGFILLLIAQTSYAINVGDNEMNRTSGWIKENLGSKQNRPYSLIYNGNKLNAFSDKWQTIINETDIDENRIKRIITHNDTETGLEIRCESIIYKDFPTVEWIVYLKNNGNTDTPIIENLKPLDIEIRNSKTDRFLLHHAIGSPANGSDYMPMETLLTAGTEKVIGGLAGRPTSAEWSYTNLEYDNSGMIIAIGWAGQWTASFNHYTDRNLQISAGQELTHFKLHPGEEVRTPMIVMQFWENGDWIRAQNIWRRWMKAHNMPKPSGKLPEPMLLASSARAYTEMVNADEASQIMFIDRYLEEGIKPDYWWMDAGWYMNEIPVRGFWPIGSYYDADPLRFPNGIGAISDHAHSKGIKTLLWFEPENVYPQTWLMNIHPDWVLKSEAYNHLLNLGNPEALKWRTNNVDRAMKKAKADIYRQDFNMDPLPYWRNNDPEDRQGINEIKHCMGYLTFWDELRRRYPNILIDSCASGGRRNEVESMRRSVPLWRSDYAYEPIGHQGMTYGISLWLPYHGTGTVATANASYYGGGESPVEPYAFWSNAAPSIVLGIDVRSKEIDYPALKKLIEQWRSVNHLYYGDYYPMTPYSRDSNKWIGWQFNDEDLGEGMIQVFRRNECINDSIEVKPRGLDKSAEYKIYDINKTWSKKIFGKTLMEVGFKIKIETKPGVETIVIKKISR